MQTSKEVQMRQIAANHAHAELTRIIEEFFDYAEASTYLQMHNEVLSAYLEQSLDTDHPISNARHIQDVVFTMGMESKFITSLREQWQQLKQAHKLDTDH